MLNTLLMLTLGVLSTGCGTLLSRSKADIGDFSGCYPATRLDACVIEQTIEDGWMDWSVVPWSLDFIPSIVFDTVLLPVDLLWK